MVGVSSFPLLSPSEFQEACEEFVTKFRSSSVTQNECLSADLVHRHDCQFLKLTRPLVSHGPRQVENAACEEVEFSEEDEEALVVESATQALVEYDIILSPSYQVPVLYFGIKDPAFQHPPTMETLYQHLVPPLFKPQAKSVGVIGGITITDHPVTNSPTFFIHPCQTAAVLEASLVDREISPLGYLMLWMGAMGPCVGLHIPLTLAANGKQAVPHSPSV